MPFEMIVTDGMRSAVRHPEFLSHPGRGRVVILWENESRHRVVDLSLVSMLEFGLSKKPNRRKAG